MNAPLGTATKVLMAVNLLLGLVLFSDQIWRQALIAGGLFPGRFLAGDGGFDGFLLPVWLTPVSHAFLHGGLVHLLFNMMMLLVTGKLLERIYGARQFLLLYAAGLVSAAAAEVTASLLQWYGAVDPFVPAIGASGAISALIAANIMLFPKAPPRAFGPIPAAVARPVSVMLGWIVFNALFGFVAGDMGVGIAIWSHIGGFAAGLVLAIPLLRWKYRHA